jgi:hypothetical protein
VAVDVTFHWRGRISVDSSLIMLARVIQIEMTARYSMFKKWMIDILVLKAGVGWCSIMLE